MKNEKKLENKLKSIKNAIVTIGDIRPGHLSIQKRDSGKNKREYVQLSYTFQKRSRTDYIQNEDIERIKTEIANYKKFKELCEEFVALSIEISKEKTKRRSTKNDTHSKEHNGH